MKLSMTNHFTQGLRNITLISNIKKTKRIEYTQKIYVSNSNLYFKKKPTNKNVHLN